MNSAADQAGSALSAFADIERDPVELFRGLVGAIRPQRGEDAATAIANFTDVVERLEVDAATAAQVRRALDRLLASRQLVSFFTDSGILPGTGFFSELWRLCVARLLPEVRDETNLGDCLTQIFFRRDDWRWVGVLPDDLVLRFWVALGTSVDAVESVDKRKIQEQLLEATLLLAYRIAGLGVEREFGRLLPDFIRFKDSFLSLADEAHRFVAEFRQRLDGAVTTVPDERHLLVMVDQCDSALQRARRASLQRGTNLRLTFMLRRGHQSLQRLAGLVQVLGAQLRPEARTRGVNGWLGIAHETIHAENRRRSISHHVYTLIGLLALRVTDNAARTGEHYITSTRAEYLSMWRTAGCAGFVIAVLALLKIFTGKVALPPGVQALAHSLIYGGGFVLIYLLHWTIATKQPAMTAQTMATYLQEAESGRGADLDRIVDLIAGVTRSQLAAILGNVSIALPTAMLIGYGWARLHGAPLIDTAKAFHLLNDLHPLSLAIPHAALAGVFLFMAGLISGYFDNRATYGRFGERIAQLPWLQSVVGRRRAERVGGYLERNFGGLAGNFLFGCMLGSAGAIGVIFGLPIDIRHVAFASANLGYALQALDFSVGLGTLGIALCGLGLVGFTNLTVSFSLALWVALRSRRVEFSQSGQLIRLTWTRLRQAPRAFFLPPRDESGAAA